MVAVCCSLSDTGWQMRFPSTLDSYTSRTSYHQSPQLNLMLVDGSIVLRIGFPLVYLLLSFLLAGGCAWLTSNVCHASSSVSHKAPLAYFLPFILTPSSPGLMKTDPSHSSCQEVLCENHFKLKGYPDSIIDK